MIGHNYPDVDVPPPDDCDALGPVFRRSWQQRDLSAVLDGSWKAPEPTVGRRSDGVGLFYPGKLHTVSSESEGGKTWFMLSVVLDELTAGKHVVYVDFEDDEGGIVGRLLTLQAPREALIERFHYVRPEDALGSGIHADDLNELLRDVRPTLAVVDGVTEAMDPEEALFGEERLLAIAGAQGGVGAEVLNQAVVETVRRFVRGAEQSDDITLLTLRRRG